jgi:hypothetical protein
VISYVHVDLAEKFPALYVVAIGESENGFEYAPGTSEAELPPGWYLKKNIPIRLAIYKEKAAPLEGSVNFNRRSVVKKC